MASRLPLDLSRPSAPIPGRRPVRRHRVPRDKLTFGREGAVAELGATVARLRDLGPAGSDRVPCLLPELEHDDLGRSADEALGGRFPRLPPPPSLPQRFGEEGPEAGAPIVRREGVYG